jgi:hypothetical protein
VDVFRDVFFTAGIALYGATLSEQIAEFLHSAIKSNLPKSNMMLLFQSQRYLHPEYPSAKQFFDDLEDAGFSYQKMFTCEEHHPLQAADQRNEGKMNFIV